MATELVRQAIELEQKTSEWLEPAYLSPNHAKLLQHLTTDQGAVAGVFGIGSSTGAAEKAVGGSQTDPAIDSDFATAAEAGAASGDAQAMANDVFAGMRNPVALADALKQISQIQSRNATGGNRARDRGRPRGRGGGA